MSCIAICNAYKKQSKFKKNIFVINKTNDLFKNMFLKMHCYINLLVLYFVLLL